MTVYIRELNWKYNFQETLLALLDLTTNNKMWANTISKPSQYCNLGHSILRIPVYRQIIAFLAKHNIRLTDSFLRKMNPYSRIGVHTDNPKLLLSLNIPLLNSNSAITSWYDFKSNKELNSLNSIATEIPVDSPLITMKTQELLPYKVFEYRMTKPTIFNNSIHHNVEVDQNVERFILTMTFVKLSASPVNFDDLLVLEQLKL